MNKCRRYYLLQMTQKWFSDENVLPIHPNKNNFPASYLLSPFPFHFDFNYYEWSILISLAWLFVMMWLVHGIIKNQIILDRSTIKYVEEKKNLKFLNVFFLVSQIFVANIPKLIILFDTSSFHYAPNFYCRHSKFYGLHIINYEGKKS